MKNTLLFLLSLFMYSHLIAQGFALSFDGINDYGQGLNPLFPSVSADDTWTLELWIKTSTSGTLVAQFSGNSTSIFFDVNGDGKVSYKKGGTVGNLAVVQSMSRVDDGNWHHIAVAKGGSGTNQVRLFIDGVLEDTGTDNTEVSSGSNTSVARLQAGPSGFYFTGEMDELRLWSIALSSTAIANNLANEFADPASPSSCLIRYYQMTNGEGINVTSNSGGSVIRLQGGTAWVNSTAPVSSQPAPNCADILPVELLDFKAQVVKEAIQLSWQTSAELNNKGFAIEHSLDAEQWKQITFVAGVGTSHQLQNYDYKHLNPHLGINYYRLKQVDEDGHVVYLGKAAVDFYSLEQPFQVFPNPVSDGLLTLNMPPLPKAKMTIRLSNQMGQIVKEKEVRPSSEVLLNVGDLSKGVYYLSIVLAEQYWLKKVLVN